MVWRTLGRLILIPIAFVIAGAITAFILVTLGLEHLTRALHGQKTDISAIEALLAMIAQGGLLASGATLIPAIAAVIVGEVARIRSWLYYMLSGGAALAAIPLLARSGSLEASAMPPAIVWQVMATAGFAGGFVYWLIAGRNA